MQGIGQEVSWESKRGMVVRVDPHLLLSRDDWPAREELYTKKCSDVGNETFTNVPGSVDVSLSSMVGGFLGFDFDHVTQ